MAAASSMTQLYYQTPVVHYQYHDAEVEGNGRTSRQSILEGAQ